MGCHDLYMMTLDFLGGLASKYQPGLLSYHNRMRWGQSEPSKSGYLRRDQLKRKLSGVWLPTPTSDNAPDSTDLAHARFSLGQGGLLKIAIILTILNDSDCKHNKVIRTEYGLDPEDLILLWTNNMALGKTVGGYHLEIQS